MMKHYTYLVLLTVVMAIVGCSANNDAAVAAAEEQAALEIDSTTQVIEAATLEVEEDKEALEDALEELDALFPENN